MKNQFTFVLGMCLAVIVLVLVLTVFWDYIFLNPPPTQTLITETNSPLDDQIVLSPLPTPAQDILNVVLPDTESINEDHTTNPIRPVAAPSQFEHVRIRIVDALGDAVRSGAIDLNQKTFNFTDGELNVFDIPNGAYQLVCNADNYASATNTIQISADNREALITLEYLCDYHINVFFGNEDEFQRPVSGAEVYLYKGPVVQRPLSVSARIPYMTWRGTRNYAHIKRNDDIKVVGIDSGVVGAQDANSMGASDFYINDKIAGISGCMWHSNSRIHFPHISADAYQQDNSRRLRIWDALTCYTSPDINAHLSSPREQYDYVDIKRGQSDFFCKVGIPVSKKILSATAITDANGKCQFRNLPAGTYIAQAHKGQFRSSFKVLHPAVQSRNLFISSARNVNINVKRAGVEDKELANLPNVEVLFTPIDQSSNSGFYSGETNQYGKINFHSIPWGTYKLRIVPSPVSSVKQKTLEVVIDEPEEKFVVELDSTSGLTISGTVIDENTGAPVENFGLELNQRNPVSGTHSRTVSDQSGRFSFTFLEKGRYCISPMMDKRYFNEYSMSPRMEKSTYPIQETDQSEESNSNNKDEFVFSFKSMRNDGLTVLLTEDINDMQYFVVSAVRTRFRGQVIDTEGRPAANVRVSTSIHLLTTDAITDEDGRFELVAVSRPSQSRHKISITAKVCEPVFNPQAGTVPRVIMRGSTDCRFSIGETINNIQIVMEKINREGKLKGQVITNDDRENFDGFRIVLHQKLGQIIQEIKSDGSFFIENIEPGHAGCWIIPPGKTIQHAIYGERYIEEYCREFFEVTIPEEPEPLSIEVKIYQAGNIAGVIGDEEGNPLPFTAIQLPQIPQSSIRNSYTDENGLFFMWGLRSGQKYVMQIIQNHLAEPSLILEDVTAPNENIQIRLDSSQSSSND